MMETLVLLALVVEMYGNEDTRLSLAEMCGVCVCMLDYDWRLNNQTGGAQDIALHLHDM